MRDHGYAIGGAEAASPISMPLLAVVLDRLRMCCNSAADIGDQLGGQANRLVGYPPPQPPSAGIVPGDNLAKLAGDAPLIEQIKDALTTLDRNLGRVGNGANRLGELG